MRLGADPELFLVDAAGKYVSVLGKLGGSKQEPLQIIDLPRGFTLQEDNVAVELGIPPAATADEYIASLRTCMAKALEALPGLHFSFENAVSFPVEELQHPGAFVFGCEPDYNAWTGAMNPKPRAEDKKLRTAGGHVHVEFEGNREKLIQNLDLFLGVPSVLMDKGVVRKQMYGKAGAYRPKSYGAEYRVLSNFWLQSDELIRWVWDNTARAVEFTKAGGDLQNFGDIIVATINNNDTAAAERLIKDFELEVV